MEEKEEIHGALEIEVKLALWSIKGQATFDSVDHKNSNSHGTEITSYTDFIVKNQPTTIPEAFRLVLYSCM